MNLNEETLKEMLNKIILRAKLEKCHLRKTSSHLYHYQSFKTSSKSSVI